MHDEKRLRASAPITDASQRFDLGLIKLILYAEHKNPDFRFITLVNGFRGVFA